MVFFKGYPGARGPSGDKGANGSPVSLSFQLFVACASNVYRGWRKLKRPLPGWQRSWKTWKVIKFRTIIFQAWAVMECDRGSWKATGLTEFFSENGKEKVSPLHDGLH